MRCSGRMFALASRAVGYRAVPIKIISVSKGNEPEAAAYANRWAEKLARYTKVEDLVLRSNPRKVSDAALIQEDEGLKVLKELASRDYVVVLDERGTDIGSEALAKLIAEAGETGQSCIAFCIGGPYGHGKTVKQRANRTIRLSSLVLNHQVARLVLLEALYRCHTILRGEPYHH